MVEKNKGMNDVKKVLITGAAGFIGYHVAKSLLSCGVKVLGIDNINDYYDVGLKQDRLRGLYEFELFEFVKADITDTYLLNLAFETFKPDYVLHLAAQAGVRYSIENPGAFIQSNIVGFFNVVECCSKFPIKHFLFASSSSVYGANKKVPFGVDDKVECPVSLYAATKKSDELIAYAYSKLKGMPTTGLRFFTVYGPMGRPDMAYYTFANMITKGKSIQIYNNGEMFRDFTYIDDVVNAIDKIIYHIPENDGNGVPYKIYNIGSGRPIKLLYFVECLEKSLGIEAQKKFVPIQPGDVVGTYADISDTIKDIDYKPKTLIEDGVNNFIKWYIAYYNL